MVPGELERLMPGGAVTDAGAGREVSLDPTVWAPGGQSAEQVDAGPTSQLPVTLSDGTPLLGGRRAVTNFL